MKMEHLLKSFLVAGILFFTSGSTFVAAQVYQWAIGMGGAGYDMAEVIASDPKGNVYVTGSFEDTIDLDPGPGRAMLIAEEGGDIFVAKYDAGGNYVWGIKIGGKDTEYSLGIDVDRSGNVYVTGYFDGATDFDPGADTVTLAPAGNTDVFLAKYDPDGRYLWAISMGGSGSDNGSGLKLDTAGNPYVVGYYNSVSADFDPGADSAMLQREGNYDVFIAKYDRDGKYLWAISMGGSNVDYGYAIDVDVSGNAYITGTYNSTVADFNPGPDTAMLRRVQGNDIFVAKYDRDGRYVWAFSVGGSGLDQGREIAVDPLGYVYVAGHFASAIVDFDPGADTSKPRLRTKGADDIFIAKYDKDGRYVWARNVGGKSVDYCYGMDVNTAGDVYITGYYNEEADFDGITGTAILKAEGGTDMYLARYDTDGKFEWAGNMGGTGTETAYDLAVNDRGDIYVSGFFTENTDFDPGPGSGVLTAVARFDAFVVKFICTDTSSAYQEVAECLKTFVLNGEEYPEPGTYTQHLPNATGCDSTLVFKLSFYQIKPEITTKEFLLGVDLVYASYQWIKDGSPIAGATGATYIVVENGDYQVSVVTERGCEGISEVYRVSNSPGSVTNPKDLGRYITVYPNPANDRLYINSPVVINVSLQSIEGYNILYKENAGALSLENLPAGLYLLKITDINGKVIKVEKIVKTS